MAGLKPDTPAPVALTAHQQPRVLELAFDDGAQFRIPFQLMRVYSPSAEVQGHGPGQEVLQIAKRELDVTDIAAVGHYAVQLRFREGHDTGVFSWDCRCRLGAEQAQMWQHYERTYSALPSNKAAKFFFRPTNLTT